MRFAQQFSTAPPSLFSKNFRKRGWGDRDLVCAGFCLRFFVFLGDGGLGDCCDGQCVWDFIKFPKQRKGWVTEVRIFRLPAMSFFPLKPKKNRNICIGFFWRWTSIRKTEKTPKMLLSEKTGAEDLQKILRHLSYFIRLYSNISVPFFKFFEKRMWGSKNCFANLQGKGKDFFAKSFSPSPAKQNKTHFNFFPSENALPTT